eukprot:2808783-Rhodomonas_salina.2
MVFRLASAQINRVAALLVLSWLDQSLFCCRLCRSVPGSGAFPYEIAVPDQMLFGAGTRVSRTRGSEMALNWAGDAGAPQVHRQARDGRGHGRGIREA